MRDAADRAKLFDTPASAPKRPARTLFDEAKMHLADDELTDAFDALSRAHRLDKSDSQVSFLLGLVALDLD